VPEIVLVAVDEVNQPAVIPLPGALISTQAPQLEYDALASFDIVAPTVIAEDADAGE
jgi:hypothetical protein